MMAKNYVESKLGFFIGDLERALNDEDYGYWLGLARDCEECGLVELPCGLSFMCEHTAHGSGTYWSGSRAYRVDGSCIGVVPLEIAERKIETEPREVILGAGMASMVGIDGVLFFNLSIDGCYTSFQINTNIGYDGEEYVRN